ncbi:MAG: peptidoglycan bridge formation glycyltransferase FemA/FemB family protein, partial [Turicibacter sp.]|nr:peptidoglycan bridge formation glycyltransferase FemA/FemB family protein [Turicibacter sp.]
MKFLTNLSAERFNTFATNHQKNHFLQSYEWGVFKSKSPDWSFDMVGLEDESGNLVAGALVLIRFLPMIKRPFLYIPRGYIIDFNNKELLKTFTDYMDKYAKSKKAIFIKIDP